MSRVQLFLIGQAVLFWLLVAVAVGFPPGQPLIPRIVGFVLIIVGFAVAALAVWGHIARNRTLPSVAPTPNSQAALVETGLYAWVRHPIYTGVLLVAFGVALAHGHIAVLLVALALVVFFTFKSRYEESLLRVAYPQYDAYMARTGRFLPFL